MINNGSRNLLLLFTSLVACDHASPEIDLNTDLGKLTAFGQAYCGFYERCAGSLGRLIVDVPSCTNQFTAVARCPDREAQPQVHGDVAQTRACVAALEALSCAQDPDEEVMSGACFDLFAGPTAHEGESCLDAWCEPGTYCDGRDDFAPGDACPLCRRPSVESKRGLNEPCEAQHDCDDALYCDYLGSDTCVARRPIGDPCLSARECASDLCSELTETCIEPVPLGGLCAGYWECAGRPGHRRCSEGVCVERSAPGGSCTYDSDCAEPAICAAGTCVVVDACSTQDEGAACLDGTCADGLYCDDHETDLCQQSYPLGHACNDNDYIACGPAAFCDSELGECVPLRQEGESCLGDYQCVGETARCVSPTLTCATPRPDGEPCEVAAQCASYACVDTDGGRVCAPRTCATP